MTKAQKSFWSYIRHFHRLPNNPTVLQRQIFATTGTAPDFKYIKTSTSSLFSDVEGMKSFRPVFAERYSWVRKLLDQEKITLRVDEELYQGSTEEILVRSQKKFPGMGKITSSRPTARH